MVAGTAAAVGMALVSERRPEPAFAGPMPQHRPLVAGIGATVGQLPNARDALARKLTPAALIALGVLVVATSIPAVSALISSIGSSSSQAQPLYGPPVELRSSSGIAGDWARSYSDAVPPAQDIGAAVIAGVGETRRWHELSALLTIAAEQDAQSQAAASSRAHSVAGAAPAPAAHAASGYGAGTSRRSRITIYGCTGPGGGFCGHMSNGETAYEGAAACSSDLALGTRLTIDGDPTGRTYVCLDRGMLAATWIDVFFHDTRAGMAWQSQMGTTVTNIHIVN
jgi:hypothetical protein